VILKGTAAIALENSSAICFFYLDNQNQKEGGIYI